VKFGDILAELIINEPELIVNTTGLLYAGSLKIFNSHPTKFADGAGSVNVGDVVTVVLIQLYSYKPEAVE
jgi:hypothetical protein